MLDEARNIPVFGFGASYIRGLTVVCHQNSHSSPNDLEMGHNKSKTDLIFRIMYKIEAVLRRGYNVSDLGSEEIWLTEPKVV